MGFSARLPRKYSKANALQPSKISMGIYALITLRHSRVMGQNWISGYLHNLEYQKV